MSVYRSNSTSYQIPVSYQTTSKPMKKILSRLWDGIHILAMTFDPIKKKDLKYTFKCFFQNLAILLPDESARNNMTSFMREYPIDDYLTSKSRIFLWTYLLHDYINKKTGSTKGISLQEARKKYSEESINKARWGRAFWVLIHTITKYLPRSLSQSIKVTYYRFMDCIQKLLPCDMCSYHMFNHMKKYKLENYLISSSHAFLWTFILHNVVNISTGVPIIKNVKDAWLLY